MTHGEQLFLEGGEAKDNQGSRIHLEPFLPTEQKLDSKLWLDPKNTRYDIQYLLQRQEGRLTPTLSRLALKGVCQPLFIRAFQGQETTDENDEAVEQVAFRNAVVLQRYLELVDNKDVDQKVLDQAINEAVTLQLVSRTVESIVPDVADVMIFPTTAAKGYEAQPTLFTVLRSKSLGRAQLLVADINHNQRPMPEDPGIIYIRPAELTGPKTNVQRLAKVLVAEQQLKPVEPIYSDLIPHATAYLYNKIYNHFEDSNRQRT